MSLVLRSQAALSTAVHIFPRLLESEARRRTGLTDKARDLLLRWRAQTPAADYQVADNSSWVHLPGFPDADPQKPETWRNVTICIGALAMNAAVLDGGKPAVAYMPAGSDQLMFGVNELQRLKAEMLTPVSIRGTETADQEVYAVQVREGADPVSFAIGYELNDKFSALPTQRLIPEVLPVDTPLYRV